MAREIRWGILATGGIAHRFAQDFSLVPDARIVAVGSRRADAAEAFRAEFGIARAHDSYEALVADPEVDVIYVATPHPFHAANATLALEHDKAVLVEKAFTMTAAEASDLVTLARSRRLFLMEAMWTRFLPQMVALRELLKSGRLGELVSLEADHGQWFAHDPSHRLFAPELGGGAVLDLGVYPISFASMIFGRPSEIVSRVEPAFTGVDGTVSMLFRYPGGRQAMLSTTSQAKTPTTAVINGRDARVEFEGPFYAPSVFHVVDRNGSRETFDFRESARGLYHQALEVNRCLREGALESPVMPLDESVAIMADMERVLAP